MIDLAAKALLSLAADCRSGDGVTLSKERAQKVATAINNVLVRIETAEAKPVSSPSPAGGVREALSELIDRAHEFGTFKLDGEDDPMAAWDDTVVPALVAARAALSSPATGEVVEAEPKSELGTCQRCGMEMSWSYDCPNRADPIDAISTRNCPDARAAINPAPGHGEGGL